MGRGTRGPEPPTAFRRFLATVTPRDGAAGPSLLGDLHEEFVDLHARRGGIVAAAWYAWQALLIGVPYLASSGRRAAVAAGRGIGLDARHAGRALAATPGSTGVAVLSLALGIGLSVSAAAVVEGIWFPPAPYPEMDRLVDLEDVHPVEVCEGCSAGTSYRSYLEWREEATAFRQVAAMEGRTSTLALDAGQVPLRVAAVSGDLHALLDVRAFLGRVVLPEDDRVGAQRVVVLTHPLWKSVFGGDPSVLGREVRLDGTPHTVVGVLEEGARLPDRSRAWVALAPDAPEGGGYEERGLWVMGRLADGVGIAEAERSLSAMASQRYAAAGLDPGWTARVLPLKEVLEAEAPPLSAGLALMAATLLALLIACMNLAAILLARVLERDRELSIRVALGSGRWRLVRVAVSEAVLLAGVGGGGGVVLATYLTALLAARTEGLMAGWVDFSMDPRALLFSLAATFLTAAACGTLPMLSALRVRPTGLIQRLARRPGPGRNRRQDWLLGAQVALGLVLVAGAGTAAGLFLKLSDLDTLGFRVEGLATVSLTVGEDGEVPERGMARVGMEAAAVLGSHPGVAEAVAAAPLFLGSWGGPEAESPVRVEGSEAGVANTRVPRHSVAVGPGYFDLLRIPVRSGRGIGPSDVPGGTPAAVVSVDAGAALWPGIPPSEIPGRRFLLEDGGGGTWFTVVGVAEDVVVNYRHPSRRTQPRIYTALAQTPEALLSRTGRNVSVLFLPSGSLPDAADVTATLRPLGEGVAVSAVSRFEDVVAEWITPARLTANVMLALSALAVANLLLGVYGTLSYRVATRRFEMGLRAALGAQPWRAVGPVVAGIARVLLVSVVVGTVIALAVGRATRGGDVPLGGGLGTVVGASLALLALCAVACVPPVRRAYHVDPMATLREE